MNCWKMNLEIFESIGKTTIIAVLYSVVLALVQVHKHLPGQQEIGAIIAAVVIVSIPIYFFVVEIKKFGIRENLILEVEKKIENMEKKYL